MEYALYYGFWLFAFILILLGMKVGKNAIHFMKENPNNVSLKFFLKAIINYYGGILFALIVIIVVMVSIYNQMNGR